MGLRLLAAVGVTTLAASLLGAVPAQAAPPDAPAITAVNAGAFVGSVKMSWRAPNSPGITNYRLRYQTINPVGPWSDPQATRGPDTYAAVGGLTLGKQYVFQVSARNADGWGAWSNDSQPVLPAALNPPTDLQATPVDGGVELSWNAPHPRVLGFTVQYQRNIPGAPWLDAGATPQTSFRVKPLNPAETYFFRVSSTNGGDASSTPVTTTTPVSPLSTPGVPIDVRAEAGDASVTVSWTAPFPAPGGYELQYRVSGSDTWQPVSPTPVSGTSTTVSGLANGTTYVFQVRSVRGSASSPYAASNPATPASTWTVPAAPTTLNAVPGNGLAVMYWNVPAGNPATNYEVAYSLDNSTWSAPVRTQSTALNYTLTGLTNGASYSLRVRTINGPHSSAWTLLPGAVVPLGIPAPPFAVTGAPGDSQVTLSWLPPSGPSSPVTGYRVQYSVDGGASWVLAREVTTPSTSVVVGGLANGVGYIFRVQSTSQSGDSLWSATSAVVVPPGAPGSPTNVVASAGDATATVRWSPPADAQGYPLLGYRVTATPGGHICTTSATPPAIPTTSCTVTGLTNGQAYTFTVVAISVAGTSAPSTASAPVTPVASAATIRITDSNRDGRKVIIKGATQGFDPGDTLDVLIRNDGKGAFGKAGEVTIRYNGTFRWTTTTSQRTWVRVTDGDIGSNTVIVPAR